jgi:hypothetical protein
MQSDVKIDAQELTRVATHLRTTLFEMTKTVERFDNAAAGLIQYAEGWIDRFEKITERLEKTL